MVEESISAQEESIEARRERGPRRVRVRTRRPIDIVRGRLWNRRFSAFTAAGFSYLEAEWAADSRLLLTNRTVRLVMKARRLFIRDWVKAFGGTRQQAIDEASKMLRDRNRRFGLTGGEEYNIFREMSP